ncbi:MAG TPA: hypothetical protein VD905_20395 [Flavobacteriales bacterium]|nr:hypothetical protein [Flavobacteriales bacterium]
MKKIAAFILFLVSFIAATRAQILFNLWVQTFGSSDALSETHQCHWGIDSIIQEYDGILPDKIIYLGWIPDSSCLPVDTYMTNLGQGNAPGSGWGRVRAERYFGFRINHPDEMDSLNDFLLNDIMPNDLFVLCSFNYFDKGVVLASNPG